MKTIEKIQLDGVDVNIQISLLEYGIAWFKTANEIKFIYSTGFDENCDCSNFCLSSFDLNTNVKNEFDFVDWKSFCSFADIDESKIDKMPIEEIIHSLVMHEGTQNVFGITCSEGLTFDELKEKYSI
tara:strand:+ start:763 stop:1143 length:381 start_codon:yes stop_codon:yes gene_type:complete